MKGWFLTGLLAFLLTACAPTVAHYRHPEAGTVVTCERWPARSDSQLGLIFQPIPVLGLVGDLLDLGAWADDRVRAGSAYAESMVTGVSMCPCCVVLAPSDGRTRSRVWGSRRP